MKATNKLLKPFVIIIVLLLLYTYMKPRQKKFDLDDDLQPTLSQGKGITKEHAIHFYEVFLNILLNKHNKFAEHAENVYLINYLIRNDVKWRVTETMLFQLFDVTGNNYISKSEYESFADMIDDVGDRQKLDSLRMLIDRNIDTKIMRTEWINFCNKVLRPKMIQDLQEWENFHGALSNPQNITAQFTAINREERNHKDLIHLQLDRGLQMLHNGFKTFVKHIEEQQKHTKNDKDLFVRKIGFWILDRFERWDGLFNWIYQLLDDNGDGQLTPKECAAQLNTFAVSMVHVREIFEYMDEDGDGILLRNEWADFSETFRKLLSGYFNQK
ncbi:unnamed protein product [Paramecium sonneborni]|uniref:EF-hand domain-containing protein n=1 Tax=Paramecium sonneborni TaxID=65129 RepID=A0A8S1N3S5_9CILI|nr:unnamed protein product [Paramecium sonneborni]